MKCYNLGNKTFETDFSHTCNQSETNTTNYKNSSGICRIFFLCMSAISRGLLRCKMDMHLIFENRL